MRTTYIFCCFLGILVFLISKTLARVAIVGGEKAAADQFKYQVSLLERSHGHECSGGIIDSRFILTAAHCFVDEHGQFLHHRISILAGTTDLHRFTQPGLTMEVKMVYVPKEYNPENINTSGDIAVLKLDKPLWEGSEKHEHLEVLKLPPNDQDTYAGQTAHISGWGWDWIKIDSNGEHGGRTDSHLLFAKTEVLNRKQCQLRNPKLMISDKQICARVKQHRVEEPRGACAGDSGSPLVHRGVVIGILSISPLGCSEQVMATVYTRISQYLEFIHKAMKGEHSEEIRALRLHA